MRKIAKRVLEDALLVRDNWNSNYRHYRGFSSAARCWLETQKIHNAPGLENEQRKVDCLTFSIIPLLGFVWAKLISKCSPGLPLRIFLGDCSGGLHSLTDLPQSTTVVPMLNYTHGQKLDLFVRKVCNSEYVLLSDDDIFFLNDQPIRWALSVFESDSRTAVVSLVPRERFTWRIDGSEHRPMGSYCLIIRRELWLAQSLSFRTVHQPSINPQSYKGEYDTADFANVELIERGYHVEIAPDSIRQHLIVFKGVSSFLLKVQSYSEARLIENMNISVDQAFYLLCAVKNLRTVVANLYPQIVSEFLIPVKRLDCAYKDLSAHLKSDTASRIVQEAETITSRLVSCI